MTTKKVVNLAETDPQTTRINARIKKSSAAFVSGLAGMHMPEHPKVNFDKADAEHEIKNQYGSSIILGRDRPAGTFSGFGGQGHTHCASVDIVAGRPAIRLKNNEPCKTNPLFQPHVDDDIDAELNFASDGARIYLSEKTMLEDNFGLVTGNITRTYEEGLRSGIGIKADLVAIMGQEGIKLVTRPDTHNSWGSENNGSIPPIDFIAGNDKADNLEPLVKGDRLVECLKKIFTQLSILEGDLIGVINSIITMNVALAFHTHPSPFGGMPTGPSFEIMNEAMGCTVRLGTISAKSCVSQTANITAAQHRYCNENGRRYINSRHVHTT